MIYSSGEAPVLGVRDELNAAAAGFGHGAIVRGIIDHHNLGAGGDCGVETGANFGGRVIRDDDDSDFGHVSLRPTTGQQKVQTPVGIVTAGALEFANKSLLRT